MARLRKALCVLDRTGEIDPPQRLPMGPGPVDANLRAPRAMSADLPAPFDPETTAAMHAVMALHRPIFGTDDRWTCLLDGTARPGVEAPRAAWSGSRA